MKLKKIISLFLLLALLVPQCACGNTNVTEHSETPHIPSQSEASIPQNTPTADDPAVPETPATVPSPSNVPEEDAVSPAPAPTPSEVPAETPTPTPTLSEPPAITPTPAPTPPTPEATPESIPEPTPKPSPEPTPTPEPSPVDQYDPISPIDYSSLVDSVSDQRRALFETTVPFEGFEDYLVNDPKASNLLSLNEVQLLLTEPDDQPETITYAQAVADVDILFRAFRTSYGAYYFWGEDEFQQAEAEIMAWLSGKESVNVFDMTVALRKSFDFMRDGHTWVGMSYDEIGGTRYEYYDCADQQFAMDEKGYYKLINAERWDFVSFSHDDISMKPTLLESGSIVYSPVLFTCKSAFKNSSVQLKNAKGEIRTESLVWSSTTPFGSTRNNPDYHFLEENGIAYISMRKFREFDYPELYAEFAQTGTLAGNWKLLIFDIRSNGGGNGRSMYEWIENITGERPELREAKSGRNSTLKEEIAVDSSSFTLPAKITSGKFLENDLPIIVLVDDLCGSAGEQALGIMKTLENVLVVGSNSNGCQLGGSPQIIYLPESEIRSAIGTEIRFLDEIKNIDCIGYEPDVWCDPSKALDAVLNMLAYYDLADVETISTLGNRLDLIT